MPWKETSTASLTRATGYQLQRAGTPAAAEGRRKRTRVGEVRAGDRLVEAPVFVICTLRSGSTLLRVLLDSHSQIRSPHELHLRYVSVHFDQKWSERSMAELGLDTKAAEYLLWDRLLQRELAASGKSIIADKTPNNVFIVDRLRECWPDARFIFLLRHPGAIARSRQDVRGEHADDDEKNADLIRRYCEALEAARQTYDGHTVRYEDLTADPRARDARRSARSSASRGSRGCSSTASSTTAATRRASATGPTRSRPARSSRPSRRRRSRRSRPRCARCA